MDTIIDRVVRAAGRHEGPGDGIESGPFSAVVEVRALQGGRGAELTYVATAPDGSLLHEEHTILALDMWSGEPTLYVLCAELEGMGQLSQVSETTFTNGRDHETCSSGSSCVSTATHSTTSGRGGHPVTNSSSDRGRRWHESTESTRRIATDHEKTP